MRPGCVVFENGCVTDVEEFHWQPAGADLHDFSELIVMPGLIDSHIHINEPGRTEWEGFATATRAAAAGGYTCLIDMPLNSVPATTNVGALEAKRAAADGRAVVDYAFWGGTVQGNAGDLRSLARAGVRGFKAFLVHPGIEEFSMVGETDLREAMPIIANTGLPLLVHAEVPRPVEAAERLLLGEGADWSRYVNYLRSRPDQAERDAVHLLIELCREYRCHVHIVHLATAQAVAELTAAREEGLPITVETCPHYLYFAAESVPDGATMFKCAPPIRRAANRELLWQALGSRSIDLIATDHSPCPPEMKGLKEGNFRTAWGGIGSVSVALPAVWTGASARGFEVRDVVRWMSEQPAQLAGLQSCKGKIALGYDADFAVFDPAIEWTVTPESLHFRHPISPYLGQRLKGEVAATFVRGVCVFREGAFIGEVYGRECPV